MGDRPVPMNRATLRRFTNAVRAFLTSEVRSKARGMFALLFVFALAVNGLNVVNSYVGRDFMTAISHRDHPGFVRQAFLYIGVFAASTLVAVLYRFTEERLGLFWRVWMTQRLTKRYLENRTYLWLKDSAAIDNPDQRIADDVRAFTFTTLSFTLMSLNGILAVLSFSGVLWSISPLLFGVAVAYAAIGTAGAVWLGLPLVGLNYRQSDQEANFRADLIHVRENAESIALLQREGRLTERLDRRINGLAENFRRITSVNRNLSFFTTGYNYLVQIIPTLIVAPLFIRGEVEFGVVTQSAMAFAQLLGAFSLIVNQVQSLSSFAAVTARLSALGEAVENRPATSESKDASLASGATLAYSNVTLTSPDDSQVLVGHLSLTIPRGTNVLVVGPIEAARVALFRATAGLWRDAQGALVRPPFDEMFFLPQRPYLPPGTLRDLVLRTGQEQRIGDERIQSVLAELGVDHIPSRAGGMEVERDWQVLLSLGEQQKLAAARLILARPAYAILDRLSSSLAQSEVRRVLERLRSHSISFVYFAETKDLSDLCEIILELNADGTWRTRGGVDASRAEQ
jgi:vitamin B12/bleomycin/antimicrobial peptide transport system ATP-binding/permease protein